MRKNIPHNHIAGLLPGKSSFGKLPESKLPQRHETGTCGRNRSGKRRSRNLRRLVLVRITHDPGHTRQRCQLFRRALRVAASHQNAAIRIHPLQPPYRCARILIRALGHRAGIQHDNFGVPSRPGALQSALQKLPFQRRPIRLRGAAAKIFYVEAGHAPILNEWMLRLKLT